MKIMLTIGTQEIEVESGQAVDLVREGEVIRIKATVRTEDDAPPPLGVSVSDGTALRDKLGG